MLKSAHHTQTKTATKMGLTIVVTDTEYQLVNAKGEVIANGPDLKDLLATQAKLNAATTPKAPRKAKAKKAAKSDDESEDDEGADDEEETEEGDKSASVVKPKYKARYAERALKGTCSDAMAKAFAAFTKLNDEGKPDPKGDLDMGRVRQVAADNGVSLKGYKTSGRGWQGRQRMTLGNILRGMIRQGTDVKVGTQSFKGDEVKPKTKKVRKAKAKKKV